MSDTPTTPERPEPLEMALTQADDRLLLNHWMPPQARSRQRRLLTQRAASGKGSA
jgi:hypothetical protein